MVVISNRLLASNPLPWLAWFPFPLLTLSPSNTLHHIFPHLQCTIPWTSSSSAVLPLLSNLASTPTHLPWIFCSIPQSRFRYSHRLHHDVHQTVVKVPLIMFSFDESWFRLIPEKGCHSNSHTLVLNLLHSDSHFHPPHIINALHNCACVAELCSSPLLWCSTGITAFRVGLFPGMKNVWNEECSSAVWLPICDCNKSVYSTITCIGHTSDISQNKYFSVTVQ